MIAPEQYRIGKLVRWKHPDREWLRYHYIELNKTTYEIAAEIGANPSTPARWVRAESIVKSWPYEDAEWLRYQYITLDKSLRQIADEIGVSTIPITKRLKQCGIQKTRATLSANHSRRMFGEGNPAYRNGTSRRYHWRVLLRTLKPQCCAWCGTTSELQVHHKDHDKHNGNADNLDWLCGPCNRMEAQLRALTDAGRATIAIENNRIIITFTRHQEV